MKKQADIIRDWLYAHKVTQDKLASDLGMSRQNLVYHLKSEPLNATFREKLFAAGYEIDLSNDKAQESGDKYSPITLSPDGKVQLNNATQPKRCQRHCR